MAGVPEIMRAMFDGIRHTLKGGRPMQSVTVSTYLTEGTIARELTAIQNRYPDVEIGSYPFVRDGRLGTSLVSRCEEVIALGDVKAALLRMIKDFGGEIAAD